MAGALFFTQLDQALRVMGQPTSVQDIIQGIAIAVGMAVGTLNLRRLLLDVPGQFRNGGGALAFAGIGARASPDDRIDRGEEPPHD